MTTCPLCGHEFDETVMSCHASCAFNESCGIVCCPNCGYQMPDENKLRIASALRRMLIRQQETQPVRPLSAMLPGQTGRIVTIQSENHARVEHLHVLGMVENATITVEQRRPAFVLRVGFTELSLEREIAETILVDTTPPPH